jgi:hypothetical protein
MMLKVNIYAAAVIARFLLALTASTVALAEEADQRIFFFGNSFTYYNGGVELMVKAMLEEALGTTVEAQASTHNGAKLPRHLQDLDGSNGETVARQALITGNNTSWDLVVLQDQSSVPAYTYSDSWYESRDAGVELNKLIEPTGAVTMFLHTWGYREGVDGDPLLTDFPSMQIYLDTGYRLYQQAANNPRSFVAPAGIAYHLVFDDTTYSGGTQPFSLFTDLYSSDGIHPSDQGSYLAACVVYAAYTGLSVAELEWAPAFIDAERRDYLQSKADEAVFDDDTFFPSLWDITGGNDLKPTASPISNPTYSGMEGTYSGTEGTVVDEIRGDWEGTNAAVPTVAPSISPSAAPRTAGMVMDLLISAAMAWVILMI